MLKYSLRPVAAALAQRLGSRSRSPTTASVRRCGSAVARCHDGDVLLLENVRFHAGEERNDPAFAAELAELGDLYVNDAFGTAHRAHASTEGVAHLLPNAAGLLMEAELAALARLTDDPVKPFVCVIGGAKVKDKIGVFTHLMNKRRRVLYRRRHGEHVSRRARHQRREVAARRRSRAGAAILDAAAHSGVALHLPTDAVVATCVRCR